MQRCPDGMKGVFVFLSLWGELERWGALQNAIKARPLLNSELPVPVCEIHRCNLHPVYRGEGRGVGCSRWNIGRCGEICASGLVLGVGQVAWLLFVIVASLVRWE